MTKLPNCCASRPEDEHVLIERVRRGDRAAFTELVELHYPAIHSLVHRLLTASTDADDVVQEVFVRVLQRLPSFRGDASFKTWLIRIAINQCRSHQRWLWVRNKAHRGLAERRVRQPAVDTRSDADWQVSTAVDDLPSKYREVIVLRYFEDLSVQEISTSLGVSVSAVEARLSRARRRLKERLIHRFQREALHGSP